MSLKMQEIEAKKFKGPLDGTAKTLGRNGDTGTPMTFNWSGKSGQPSWLWGGTDGTNMYVYNPSNFSVASATKATQDSDGNQINTTYLKKSGGTMTGGLTTQANQYTDNYTAGALHLANSNIDGVNAVFFADLQDNAAEGIQFYRTATTVDSLYAKNGVLYFTPNRTLGSAGTDTTILTSANYNNYAPSKTGVGASGSWSINAATATSAVAAGKATNDSDGNKISDTYLKLSGGNMTGNINFAGSKATTTMIQFMDNTSDIYGNGIAIGGGGATILGSGESAADWAAKVAPGTEEIYIVSDNSINFISNAQDGYGNANQKTATFETNGNFKAPKVYGAVWNDYAEYRNGPETAKPGMCVVENGDDTLSLSSKKFQKGAMIVSDTFGFAIGQTEVCGTPIAVSGRVLAYTQEGRDVYRDHIGDCVCAGPNGKICLMTDEEAATKPASILGTVSAVPDYETWGEENVAVNGRVWIKVR